jgi:hypothetical protein
LCIPSPTISINELEKLSPIFFYRSFSPIEEFAKIFRNLFKFASDGGKKLSAESVFQVIVNDNSFDVQQNNISCLYELIRQLTPSQASEHFENLSNLLIPALFSPNVQLVTASIDLVDKLFGKCGTSCSKEIRSLIFNFSAKLIEARDSILSEHS